MPEIKQTGSNQPKYLQLIDSVINRLQNGELRAGECLPSVNQLMRENKVSRDTVVKAYNELKKRGVVDAIPNKGYFIREDSEKVFLFLDTFSAFKEGLYNAFRTELPETTDIEMLFHHYNFRVFESMISNSIGRYSKYVIMCYDEPAIASVLKKLPPEKVLILDMKMHVPDLYSSVTQDFDVSFFNCLLEAEPRLRKYDELFFVHPPGSMHPMISREAFGRFLLKSGISGKVLNQIRPSDINARKAFVVVSDNDLATIIETSKMMNLEIGCDVGLISYNDTPLKKIIGEGITVISTDFELMGKRAAMAVKAKGEFNEIIPTGFILRGSV